MFWLRLLQHSAHMWNMSFFSFPHNLIILNSSTTNFPSSLNLIVKWLYKLGSLITFQRLSNTGYIIANQRPSYFCCTASSAHLCSAGLSEWVRGIKLRWKTVQWYFKLYSFPYHVPGQHFSSRGLPIAQCHILSKKLVMRLDFRYLDPSNNIIQELWTLVMPCHGLCFLKRSAFVWRSVHYTRFNVCLYNV